MMTCACKPQVAANDAMLKVCNTMGNRDLEPFIPALVSCIVRPAETQDIVHKLSATTFVQMIEAPALSIMVPLLVGILLLLFPTFCVSPTCMSCQSNNTM